MKPLATLDLVFFAGDEALDLMFLAGAEVVVGFFLFLDPPVETAVPAVVAQAGAGAVPDDVALDVAGPDDVALARGGLGGAEVAG